MIMNSDSNSDNNITISGNSDCNSNSNNDNNSMIDNCIDDNKTNIVNSSSSTNINNSNVNPFINNDVNDHYKFFARLFEVTKEDTPPLEFADDNDNNDDNSEDENIDNNHDDNNSEDEKIDKYKNDEEDDKNDSNNEINPSNEINNYIFTINHVIDAITIQRVYRGHLGRKKRNRTKVIRYRERLQDRYSSSEGLYRFYFEQNGAASKIQRWFRNLPWLIKKKWKVKYAKNVEKVKKDKIQRKKDKAYNRKLAALAFLDGSLDDHSTNKELIDFSTILTRFARGATVRRKLRNMKIKSIKVVIIQSAIRSFIVHCRLPKLGARTRMRIRKEKKWKILSQIVYPKHLLRRPEIFFPHLKIGDEKNIDRLEKKAFILNRAWRAYKVRRRFRQIQQDKKLRRAIRIQRWFITIRFRKQVKKSLFLLQPFWKFKSCKMKKRHRAATLFQSIVRMRLGYKRCRHIRWYKVRGIYLIQGWVRRLFGKRRVRKNNQIYRKIYEELLVGAELFKVTEKLKYIDCLWSGIKKVKKPEASHELQHFYLELTKQQASIDIARCTKFALACPGLLDSYVSVKTVEYLYTKSKPIKESRLNFETFVTLLGNIGAVKYLFVDPERITYKDSNKVEGSSKGSKIDKKGKKGSDEEKSEIVAKSIDEGDENSVDNAINNDEQSLSSDLAEAIDDNPAPVVKYKKSKLSVDEQIASYRFGKLSGRAAIVTKLVYEYIKQHPDFRKVEILLRDKAANRVANKSITSAQRKLRDWIRVRLGLKRMAKIKRLKLANVMKVKKEEAAKKIQGIFKSYMGKKVLVKLAQSIYTKYIDQETFQPYWFNPRTNKSFWKKPFLLGKADCGIPTTLPLPDEEFAANCLNCENERASMFCDECNEIYCISCYNKLHAKGARRLHNQVPIDTCIQCIFQVGSKFCISCGDSYCDTCYKCIHLKGRLRLHIFNWTCDPCIKCDKLSAQWSIVDSYLGRTLLMCVPCYKEEYGVPPKTSKDVKRIVFQGRFVKEYRLNKRNREEEKARKIAYAKQQEEMIQRKRQKSAIVIQRVYRGHVCRLRMADAMEEAKQMTLHREDEDKKRETLVYKLLETIGIAPAMKSDTAIMRAKKMFPGYMHHIVEECIQYKWAIACDLLREEENFMKTIGANISAAEKLSSGVRLTAAQDNLRKVQKKMESEKKQYEKDLVAYREAKASKKTKPEILASLLEKAKAQEVIYNSAKEAMKEQQTNLEEVTKRVNEIAGPKGLKKYIEEKRKTGILMPFTVSVRKGGRVALTKYPDNYVDPFEPKKKIENKAKFDENGVMHGRWKNRLEPGDMISIEGIIFTLTERLMVEALEFEVEEKKENDDEENSHESESESEDDSEEDDDDVQKEEKTEEVYVEEEITDDHLCLDRTWVLPDSEGLEVYKLVPKVFYYKPFYYLMRSILASYPLQKSSQITAITMYKISSLNRRIAGLFDPESETAVALNARADRFDEYKVRWLKLSRATIDMSYDFTLRRQVGGVVYGMFRVGMKAAIKMGRLLAARSGAITVSEWELWHSSNNKVDCECRYEQFGVEPTILGKFKMDLDAPANVMRSYVRVNFREILNESIGDAFEFYLPGNSGEGDKQLARTAEPMTYSKDYAPFTLDKNMDGKYIVSIIKEKEYRQPIGIPEQTDEVLTGKKSKKSTAAKEKKSKKEKTK